MANSLNKITTKSILDATVATADIAADAITGAKLADNACDSEHYTDGSIDHVHLAGDCIDGDNIQDDVINSEHIAAGAIDLEHMSSESVDEDNLHISNAGSNGQVLTKQSGNSGGLTWATVSSGETNRMPLAGGTFTGDVTFTGDNYNAVWDKSDDRLEFADNAQVTFGSGADSSIVHDGSHLTLTCATGNIRFRPKSGEEGIVLTPDATVDLYHNNVKKLKTATDGIQIEANVEGGEALCTFVADQGDDNNDYWAAGSGDGKFTLKTYGSGAWTERFRFEASGNARLLAPDGGLRYFFGEIADSDSAQLSLYDSSDAQKIRISAHSSDATFFNAASPVVIGNTSYGGGGANPALYISNNGGRQVKIHNTDDGTSGLQLTNSGSGEGDDNGLQIALLSSDDAWFNLVESAAMRFCTNQTERMRIQSNGRLHLGNDLGNDHAGLFQVINTGSTGQTGDCLVFFETAAEDWCLKSNSNISGSASHYHIDFEEEGTRRGKISGDHGSNVSYLQGSDYRWKENIVDMTPTEGLEICKKLKPRKYNWIKNREGTGKINTVDGFIAHEVVEAGVLGAVQGEKDAINEDGSIDGQTLDYGQMTPVLAAGIKGLIAEVETLKTRVASLEAA